MAEVETQGPEKAPVPEFKKCILAGCTGFMVRTAPGGDQEPYWHCGRCKTTLFPRIGEEGGSTPTKPILSLPPRPDPRHLGPRCPFCSGPAMSSWDVLWWKCQCGATLLKSTIDGLATGHVVDMLRWKDCPLTTNCRGVAIPLVGSSPLDEHSLVRCSSCEKPTERFVSVGKPEGGSALAIIRRCRNCSMIMVGATEEGNLCFHCTSLLEEASDHKGMRDLVGALCQKTVCPGKYVPFGRKERGVKCSACGLMRGRWESLEEVRTRQEKLRRREEFRANRGSWTSPRRSHRWPERNDDSDADIEWGFPGAGGYYDTSWRENTLKELAEYKGKEKDRLLVGQETEGALSYEPPAGWEKKAA